MGKDINFHKDNKIELLAPVGAMANLKVAIVSGADAVYLGMNQFGARNYAKNFNKDFLKKAVNLAKSNNVKVYLTMNTLVKNSEIVDFFDQLNYAYSMGIDAVIIQQVSFIPIIKKNFPEIKIHISTQAGVMNSLHANLLKGADRITLARELSEEEIALVRQNYGGELEVFCHGALCTSVSGQCLFSSLLGGRSGNRGRCAQPCRKKYCSNKQNSGHDANYYLSTKELCLIDEIPSLIKLNIDSLKIEGRMRTPSYVAEVTSVYRSAINSFYDGNFESTSQMKKRLRAVFSREFCKGWYDKDDVFNRKFATGIVGNFKKKHFEPDESNIKSFARDKVNVKLPTIVSQLSKKKQLLVKVYNKQDARAAFDNGADIIYFDLFDKDFSLIKEINPEKVYGYIPSILTDKDVGFLKKSIQSKKPSGIFTGNISVLGLDLNIPIHLDYNLNTFNDIDLLSFADYGNEILPIISPELSINELKEFKNKNFGVLVHGKIRLMTLRNKFDKKEIVDERKAKFFVEDVFNGSCIYNEKELGFLSNGSVFVEEGITNFFIDTDKEVGKIVRLYRDILDGKKINDKKIKKNYVLGWSYKGVW